MKAKVLNEKYQLQYKIETSDGWKEVNEDVEYKDVYWRAFQIAGTIRNRVDIARITTVEKPESSHYMVSFLDDKNSKTVNIITGLVTIDSEHFAISKLSRYHPNNGWAIPEHIDIDESLILC